MKTSSKLQLSVFAHLCAQHGMRRAVISPGSRNAPIIMAFHNQPLIECYIIPDERSAAYFALGIAQYWHEPVGIICTSGTAALNYSPALAEAYYQKLPLVAITADRPLEWIEQADGQTINQEGIYKNFTIYQSNLPSDYASHEKWHMERMVRDGFTKMKMHHQPIHFNVPLREPLYELADDIAITERPVHLNFVSLSTFIDPDLAEELKKYHKILVVTGMQHPNEAFSLEMEKLSSTKKVVIFSENLSNIDSEVIFQTSDAFLLAVTSNDSDFVPDLVISFGDMLLSKPLKTWIRRHKPIHWVVNEEEVVPDVFQKIDRHIVAKPEIFISFLIKNIPETNAYYERWENTYEFFEHVQSELLKEISWCDLMVFSILSKFVPGNSFIHLGNSSVVRYAQFFKWNKNIHFFSNRGTAGIDGISSTAAGMASQTEQLLTLIIGDMSFLYDTNAFWNNYKSKNFRIIVINNRGGNIFSLIPGPDNTGLLDKYFTAHVPVSIEYLCTAYGINYLKASSPETLENGIKNLYAMDTCCLLEIETELQTNTLQWKNYFKTIKSKFV